MIPFLTTLFILWLLRFQLVCRSWHFSCGAIHTNEDSFVMTNRWCIHSMIQPSEIGCCTSLGLFYPSVWWVRIKKSIKFYIYWSLDWGLPTATPREDQECRSVDTRALPTNNELHFFFNDCVKPKQLFTYRIVVVRISSFMVAPAFVVNEISEFHFRYCLRTNWMVSLKSLHIQTN